MSKRGEAILLILVGLILIVLVDIRLAIGFPPNSWYSKNPTGAMAYLNGLMNASYPGKPVYNYESDLDDMMDMLNKIYSELRY